MKIDIVEICDGDIVLTPVNVGSLAPSEVDAYCKKCMDGLKDVFGCKVAVFPVRDDFYSAFDFTIIRNPSRKNKDKKPSKQ